MRILLTFSAAFVVAAVTVLLAPWKMAYVAIFGILFFGLSVILLICKRGLRVAVIALGSAVGLFWCLGYQTFIINPGLSLSGQTVVISGTAADYSDETAYGIRVRAKITGMDVNTTAMVWLPTHDALMPGDTFIAETELSDARQDGSYYNWSDGVYLLAYGTEEPEIQHQTHIPVRYFPRYIAHCLEQALINCVPVDVSGYAVALTTGNRSGLSSLEREHLKTAGIYHALALSGMHLTTLLGTVFLVVCHRRRRALIGIPLSILFTVITGANSSMVRACVMQCLVLLAPIVQREEDAPTSLGAAALLLMMQNPCCILGWGTQLSFTSMAGIILLSEKLCQLMRGNRRAWKKRPKVIRKSWYAISASLSTTLSATALSLPLLMLHYGMFSIVSPLSNLLTGWVITWCFRMSLLTGLVGLFLPVLGRGLGWTLAWGIRYVSGAAGLLSRIPFAALYTNSIYVVIWVVGCYGILLLLIWMPKKQRRFMESTCCLILTFSVCIIMTLLENIGFAFTVLDVGQGQCLLARVNGQTVMIDCGGSGDEAVGDAAASYLNSLGEQRVDLLILTHYDSDHVGGVPELLKRVHVEQILMPDYQPESNTRQEIEQAALVSNTQIDMVQTSLTAEVGSCHLSIYAANAAESENNCSLAVLLKDGQTEILVTGDMDAAGERQLLRNHNLPDIDILVAGHHGSKYSTSESFLSEVQPEIVVISVGKNSYGHPAEETIERITASGAVIYRTDLHGTLRLKGA